MESGGFPIPWRTPPPPENTPDGSDNIADVPIEPELRLLPTATGHPPTASDPNLAAPDDQSGSDLSPLTPDDLSPPGNDPNEVVTSVSGRGVLCRY